MSGLTRRQAIGLFGAGTGAAALAACAPATTGGPAPAGAAATQPRRGGTLRMASPTDVNNLDTQSQGLQATKDILWQTTEPLINIGRDFKPAGFLAETWEWNANQDQLKVNLRKNVQFHSGREMDSEDVKLSFLRPNNPKLTTVSQTVLAKWVVGFEVPDKSSIVIKLDKFRPGFIDQIGTIKIVDRVATEQATYSSKTTSGTGPFKVLEWNPKQNMKLARFESWWAADKVGAVKRPYLDGIEFTVYPDAQAMIVSLESGAVDWVDIPPYRDAKRLKDSGNYTFQDNAQDVSSQHHYFWVNADRAPTNDKRVRQAIQYACDRQRMLDSVMAGLTNANYYPLRPGAMAYDPSFMKPFPFDIAKATQLVKDAGAVGAQIDFVIDNTRAEAVQLGQIWTDDVAKTGLKPNLKFTSPQDQNDISKKGTFNVAMTGAAIGSNLENYSQLASQYSHDAWKTPPQHQTYFRDETLATLIDEKIASERDQEKRRALYVQAFRIFTDNATEGGVVGRFPSAITTKKIHGVNWQPIENVLIQDVWMDP